MSILDPLPPLGAVVSQHQISGFRAAGNRIGGGIAIGFGLLLLPLAWVSAGGFGIGIGLFGAAIMAAGIWQIWQAQREVRNARFVLYEQGFHYTRPDGRSEAVTWPEIRQLRVFASAPRLATHKVRYAIGIERQGKPELSFDWHSDAMTGLKELCSTIQRRVAEAQLAGARQALQQGLTLDFGEIKASQNMLLIGTQSLPWSAVAALRVVEVDMRVTEAQYIVADGLQIYAHGLEKPWAQIPLGRLRNALLLSWIAYDRIGERAEMLLSPRF